jgi:hypothetical protein
MLAAIIKYYIQDFSSPVLFPAGNNFIAFFATLKTDFFALFAVEFFNHDFFSSLADPVCHFLRFFQVALPASKNLLKNPSPLTAFSFQKDCRKINRFSVCLLFVLLSSSSVLHFTRCPAPLLLCVPLCLIILSYILSKK